MPKGCTFGREREVRWLDDKWEDPKCRIAVVEGWGGSGKSQLVAHWLDGIRPHYGGAERVFAWSFYAQGTNPRAAVSSDDFFERALSFFRAQRTVDDAMGRAHDLASAIGRAQTLLILDGIEPLLDPLRGAVQDSALRHLLKYLLDNAQGLCVVTTRPPFTALDGVRRGAFCRLALQGLDLEAGMALLRDHGVRGEDQEMRAAVEEYQGHALSLAVLGAYIEEACQGDVGYRRGVGVTENDADVERRIERLLTSYDMCLDPARRAVLRAVALFDRPAPRACLDLLRTHRIIGDASVQMSDQVWNRAESRLKRARLLSIDDDAGTIDTHPVIRAHFARAFEADDERGYREGHGLLFDHFRDAAPMLPPTLGKMLPLYQAVAHGCHAQRWDEAFAILRDRIRQGDDHVSLKKLGAVSADLAAFACFFSARWEPVPGLSADLRLWLTNSAGVLHRAGGSLDDAWKLLSNAVEIARGEHWNHHAAEAYRNLASTESAMGKLTDAVASVEEAVRFADASGQLRARLNGREFRAHLLNRLGRLEESRAAYEEVEQMRVAEDPSGALAHYPGAGLTALLVDMGRPEEACQLARRELERTRDPSFERQTPLHIGLTKRSLARALAALDEMEEASVLLDESIAHLTEASRRDHLAPGLLDRAKCLLHRDPERAARDVDDALGIAIPRGFRLVEADAYLTRARLKVAAGDAREAEQWLQKAKDLFDETGFALRAPMCLITKARIHALLGERGAAESALGEARARIEAMGMWGLCKELSEATSSLGNVG